MDKTAREKAELCLHEMAMIKELLMAGVADDFCWRILGVYAFMRLDDLTMLFSHHISAASESREYAEEVKVQYNRYRQLRDKFGAHFQRLEGHDGILERTKVFHDFSIQEVCDMVDYAQIAFQLEAGAETGIPGFLSDNDKKVAIQILDSLNSEGQFLMTVGTLDIFSPNKGYLISGATGQGKAQHLRSIEQIVDLAHKLYNENTYDCPCVGRMFKRLLVSSIINYYDNLITRKDIKESDPQFDYGLDHYFPGLLCKRDNIAKLENAFDEFARQSNFEAYFNRLRTARGHGCSHLDRSMSLGEIDQEVDGVDFAELMGNYRKLLDFFRFIASNTLYLRMVAIQARNPVNNVDLADMNADVRTLWRSIRKQDGQCERSKEIVMHKLISHDERQFWNTASYLRDRVLRPGIEDDELSLICNILHRAKRGFPNRILQFTINVLLSYHGNDSRIIIAMLWLLSEIAEQDRGERLDDLLSLLLQNRNPIVRSFACLSLLHSLVKKNSPMNWNRDYDVDARFIHSLDDMSNPIERIAIVLALNNHWWESAEYDIERIYKVTYGRLLSEWMGCAIEGYCKYVKADEKFIETCHQLSGLHRYIQLLHHLFLREEERNQKTNLFRDSWFSNCFCLPYGDVTETVYWSTMMINTGRQKDGLEILNRLCHDYPLDEQVRRVTADIESQIKAQENQ